MFALPLLPAEATTAPLLVGFSGGLDSTVLLHRLANEHDLRERGLRAIHVHHGLHADADAWASHCRELCKQLGVALTVARVQVDTGAGEGLEAAARHARYRAFAEHLRGAEVLVTAHHQDDQAETFLLRALRASGVDGLAAMRPWRRFAEGWHWRPLLAIPRATLQAHALAHGLPGIDDPGNARTEHDRNFLRHQVLPVLAQRWPRAAAALARSAALSAEAATLLARDDAIALAQVRSLDPQALSVSALLALPAARRARVFRHWLEQLGLPPLPGEGVRRIETDLLPALAGADAAFTWQDAIVRRWRDLLHAERVVPGLALDWQADWSTQAPLPLPNGDELVLEGAAWPSPLRVTARRGGERLHQPGRKQSQALKKLLQAEGVPPWERSALPLLWDGDGELLAAGDLLHSARFDAWLRQHQARLRWRRHR